MTINGAEDTVVSRAKVASMLLQVARMEVKRKPGVRSLYGPEPPALPYASYRLRIRTVAAGRPNAMRCSERPLSALHRLPNLLQTLHRNRHRRLQFLREQ